MDVGSEVWGYVWDYRLCEHTVVCVMLLPVCARKQSEQILSVLLLDKLTGRESLQGGVQSRRVQRGDPGWV